MALATPTSYAPRRAIAGTPRSSARAQQRTVQPRRAAPAPSRESKLEKKKNHVLKVDHLVTFGGCTFKWCYHSDAVAIGGALGPAKSK